MHRHRHAQIPSSHTNIEPDCLIIEKPSRSKALKRFGTRDAP